MRLRPSAAVLLLFVSCSFDLALPDQPLRGKVVGRVDTQGRLRLDVAPQQVFLVSESGSRSPQPLSASGDFTFDAVVPGLYYLELKLPGFATLLVPNVRVRSDAVFDAGTLTPEYAPRPGRIEGTVVVTGGGDAAGGTVDFILEAAGQRVASAIVSATGSFSQSLPSGVYTLRASHPFYVSATRTGVALGDDELLDLTTTPLAMDLNPATLRGAVFREVDKQADAPAAGVVVSAGTGLTTVTDAAGNFELGGLPAGEVTVVFTLAGHHDAVSVRRHPLAPAQVLTLPPARLLLDRGDVVGQVEMSDGAALQGVTVSLNEQPYAAGVSPSTTMPDRGTFVLGGVPVGTYSVTAARSGYFAASAGPFTVVAGQAVTVSALRLTRIQGDFVIDDEDNSNTPGFTRVHAVKLVINGVVNAAEYRAAEGDPTLASAAFAPFVSSPLDFTLSAQDGTKTVYLQFRDGAGNLGGVLSANVVLDTRAPTNPQVVIASGAAFTNLNPTLPLRLTADELPSTGVDVTSGLSAVRISGSNAVDASGNLTVPRQTYALDLSFTRPVTTDGVQNVWVQFIDHAGNASPVGAPASIVVDTQPPSGSITIARGAKATLDGYTDQVFVELLQTAAAEPNGGFVSVKVANDAADLGSAVLQPLRARAGWFLDPSGQGLKTVSYRFVDAAGNASSTGSATITYDSVPPSASAMLLSPSPTNQLQVTLGLGGAGTGSPLSPTQALTLSEDPFFLAAGTTAPAAWPVSGQATFSLSAADGLKQVYVRVRDAAGNDANATVAVTLDRLPPTGSITLEGTLADGTKSSTVTAVPTVTVNVVASGASALFLGNETTVSCPAAAAMYQPLTGTQVPNVTLTGSASPRQVRACFRDEAGNTSGPVIAAIALDAAAPAGCSLGLAGRKVDGTPAPAGKTALRDVAVSAACAEVPQEMFLTQGSVTCSPTAALAWVPFNATSIFVLSGGDGPNTVRGCVRDAARNTATLPQATLTLDTTPPGPASVLIDDGAIWVNAAQVAARGGNRAQVAGAAPDAVEWAVSESTTPGMFVAFPAGSPIASFPFSAGDGVKTVFAWFRDDVGNTTPAPAADSITFDTTSPSTAGITVTVLGTQHPEFTNTEVVVVQLSGSNDAATAKVAQAASAAACAPADFAAAPTQAVVSAYTFVLSPAEALKRVCLQFFDAAGNASAVLSDTITLDTTPPTAPTVLTQSTAAQLADNAIFDVVVAGPSTDANLGGYERLGGKTTTWTATTPTPQGGTLVFRFNVNNPFPLAETGVRNELRVRAFDLAGNRSGENAVVITADTNPPDALTIFHPGGSTGDWVDNGNRQATMLWADPAGSPDIVAHEVQYGSASGVYTGSYAVEGASPLRTGPQPDFTLSGLTNGAPTFARVAAIDAAGNIGPFTPELTLQPNELSPNRISTLSLTGMGRFANMARMNNWLYVAGTDFNCFVSPSNLLLRVVDLGQLTPQVVNGRPAPPGASRPELVNPQLSFPDALSCSNPLNPVGDMVVHGGHLFVTSGRHVRIFDLRNPAAPASVADVDFTVPFPTFQPRTLHIKGDRLVVSGRVTSGSGQVHVVSLANLYDANAATTVTAANITASATNGNPFSNTAAFTRNRMFELGATHDTTHYAFNLNDAYDNLALTVFDNADRQAVASAAPGQEYPPPVSGNYVYLTGLGIGLSVYDVTSVWSGGVLTTPAVGSSAFTGERVYSVGGNQAFLANTSSGLLAIDLTDVTVLRPLATYQTGTLSSSVLVAGHTAVVASSNALSFVELATPRSLNARASVTAGGGHLAVHGGFLHSAGRIDFDLQAGAAPVRVSPLGAGLCVTGRTALFGDVEVMAGGGAGVVVTNFESHLDRNPATNPLPADTYNVTTYPAGTRVTATAEYGNYLLTAEVRGDGVWLEVFDARRLGNPYLGLQHAYASDLRGAVRVTTTTSATLMANVSVAAGRAVVTLDSSLATPETTVGQNIYLVDLGPAVDDSAATTLGAANVLGALNAPPTRDAVIQGRWLYATTNNGVRVYDVSQAMATPPGAPASADPVSTVLTGLGTAYDGLYVSGSMLMVSPSPNSNSRGVYSIDISNPVSPSVVGTFLSPTGQIACVPPLDTAGRIERTSVTGWGSRAYVLQSDNTIVELNLE